MISKSKLFFISLYLFLFIVTGCSSGEVTKNSAYNISQNIFEDRVDDWLRTKREDYIFKEGLYKKEQSDLSLKHISNINLLMDYDTIEFLPYQEAEVVKKDKNIIEVNSTANVVNENGYELKINYYCKLEYEEGGFF